MTVADQNSVALSTLANQALATINGPVMTRGGRLISVRGAAAIQTMTAGDGPHIFGIADKALSNAELLEYLALGGPVTPDAVPENEHASRGAKVRTLGALAPSGDGTTSILYLNNTSLSGLKFSEEATGWKYWALNMGSTMTTGSTLEIALQFFVEFNASG